MDREDRRRPRGEKRMSDVIVKRAGKYVVISATTGRRFGTYDTLAEAEKRLRQIEFFKHAKGEGARGRRPASPARRALGRSGR